MDHSTSSGDEDLGRASSNSHLREGNSDGRHNNRHQYHNYHNSRDRDYDTRSQSSQKSDPNSETSGRGDTAQYNLSASESVESQGSGGGGDSRGFPLHGHVHFRHPAMNANHLLNGDPAHQFPPSLYQSSADAPKSDTATVCSSSMLEDIEDVGSHYDGECSQTSSSKQHDHQYAPPSGGNTLVDFAERSQAVFPKQSKSSGPGPGHDTAAAAAGMPQEASLPNNDEDAPEHRKGMGPPLSRHWLLQHHGISPFRTGSVKSGGSNNGSDVFVNVGSDCGDMQSVLSQEDAALLTTANSENSGETPSVTASVALAAKMDALDTSSNTSAAMATEEYDEKKPHPLLCDQSGSKTSGRISPGGTIYRGRGVRRYKGRFYALPLKRFHQDGVHLHSDNEAEGSNSAKRHEDGGNYRWEERYGDDYQRCGDNHNYDDNSSLRHKRDYDRDRDRNRDRNRDRSRDRDRNRDRDRSRDFNRSRSRSRSPPTGDRKREARNRNLDQARGYKIDKNNKK